VRSTLLPRQVGRPPAGNAYDKYGSRNPFARQLVAGFRTALWDIIDRADPYSLIDVGCGEGVLTRGIADRLDERPVLGLDLGSAALRTEWRLNGRPNLEYRIGDATDLPVADREFDAGCAIELLEHVADPRGALAELRRAARRWLIVSVPREPVWRLANLARGAYLCSLGNTPGHVGHWSRRAFQSLVAQYGQIEEVRTPFPWTLVLLRCEDGVSLTRSRKRRGFVTPAR
jgi:SAM-dependent methyltransferase